MINKTISHYNIIEKLGESGMGVVYKAQDTTLDRFIALEFLPHHLGQDEENKKRFIHEAKAPTFLTTKQRRVGALDHPNICTKDGAKYEASFTLFHQPGESLLWPQEQSGSNHPFRQR